MRNTCELAEEDRLDARKSILDTYPDMRKMYAVNDGNTQAFNFKNAAAAMYNFTEETIMDS